MFISKGTTMTHLAMADFFRAARFPLRIIGIWPMGNGQLPFYFYINFVSLFFASIFGIAHAFVNLDNLYLSLDSICGSMTEFISWWKVLFVVYYRKDFDELLQILCGYFKNERRPEANIIYHKIIKYTMAVTTILGTCAFCTCSIYVFQPIITNLYLYLTGQPMFRELPFKSIYPFIDPYSDHYFIWCYIHSSHGGYTTAASFIGIDGIFIAACYHISAQFDIIAMEIEIISADRRTNNRLTQTDNLEIRKQLISAILKQIKLIEVTEHMIRVYVFIIFAHFLSAALIIGLASIDLLLASGAGKILYISYVVTVSLQLYIYANSGTQIVESSGKIHKACYSLEWHQFDTHVKNALLMMMQRSQRATAIKVPFFEVSLQAFTKIMSTAGSYITLLNSILEK